MKDKCKNIRLGSKRKTVGKHKLSFVLFWGINYNKKRLITLTADLFLQKQVFSIQMSDHILDKREKFFSHCCKASFPVPAALGKYARVFVPGKP